MFDRLAHRDAQLFAVSPRLVERSPWVWICIAGTTLHEERDRAGKVLLDHALRKACVVTVELVEVGTERGVMTSVSEDDGDRLSVRSLYAHARGAAVPGA